MAAQVEHLKSAKYATLKASHHFVPFAVETSGVLGQAALSLVWDLGQRLRQATGNAARNTSSKESPLQYRGGMQQQCSGPQGGRKTPSGDDSGEHSPPFYYCLNYYHLLIHLSFSNIVISPFTLLKILSSSLAICCFFYCQANTNSIEKLFVLSLFSTLLSMTMILSHCSNDLRHSSNCISNLFTWSFLTDH